MNVFSGKAAKVLHSAKVAHDALSCPYPDGSAKAKLWWQQSVENHKQDGITPSMRTQYGDRVIGAYKGKALVPGEAGKGQGDFQFLVDKLQICNGLSEYAAKKIALNYHLRHYGSK